MTLDDSFAFYIVNKFPHTCSEITLQSAKDAYSYLNDLMKAPNSRDLLLMAFAKIDSYYLSVFYIFLHRNYNLLDRAYGASLLVTILLNAYLVASKSCVDAAKQSSSKSHFFQRNQSNDMYSMH